MDSEERDADRVVCHFCLLRLQLVGKFRLDGHLDLILLALLSRLGILRGLI